MISVKILSIQYPERYVVRRMVQAAEHDLRSKVPGLEVEISELSDPGQIGKYAFVLVLPSLVINEKVVCSGRFPSKEEVAGWMHAAAQQDR
ncbi:MAG: thioredoxin family protein [Chloroflexota bacterium]